MLDHRQRRTLSKYRNYHDQPPTFLRMAVRYFFPRYLIAQLLLWGYALFIFDQNRDLAFLVIGISFGLIIRDLANIVQFIRIWPLFDSIFDWRKIDELLEYGSRPEQDGEEPR